MRQGASRAGGHAAAPAGFAASGPCVPGVRLSRYDLDAPRRKNIRDVDEILAHTHALASYALSPDTS